MSELTIRLCRFVMSSRVLFACLFASFGLVVIGFGQGQGNRFEGVELSIQPVAGNVHMIQRPGGGGNVGRFAFRTAVRQIGSRCSAGDVR